MIKEVIRELKKYTTGKRNTEKIEVSVLNLNRLIFALEEQEPCEDVISRHKAAIIQALKDNFIDPEDAGLTIKGEYWLAREVLAIIEGTEPKTGHWIANMNGTYTCDKCGCKHSRSNYCPNCGAKMVEPRKEG